MGSAGPELREFLPSVGALTFTSPVSHSREKESLLLGSFTLKSKEVNMLRFRQRMMVAGHMEANFFLRPGARLMFHSRQNEPENHIPLSGLAWKGLASAAVSVADKHWMRLLASWFSRGRGSRSRPHGGAAVGSPPCLGVQPPCLHCGQDSASNR